MGNHQAAEFFRRAEEAETNAKWADDPDLRRYWKNTALSYHRLAEKLDLQADDPATVHGYRLTA